MESTIVAMTDTSGNSPSAANIQGTLHLAGYLGGKRKKKDKVEKAKPKTLYINRKVVNADDLVKWAKSNGFDSVVSDLHVTVALSKRPIDWSSVQPAIRSTLRVQGGPRGLDRLGDTGDCTVLRFEYAALNKRWQAIKDAGASWDFDSYKPHITISLKANKLDLNKIEPYKGPIVLGPEHFAEVDEDYKDNIVEKGMSDVEKAGRRHSMLDAADIQQIHDLSCKQGAACDPGSPNPGLGEFVAVGTPMDKNFRIAKVDEALGVVLGWAVICKVDGQDYYDLNVDKSGSYAGERVPEHIPEDAMMKAALDFMEHSRLGNEMHGNGDSGVFVGAFPLTTEIAKAFNISTQKTGLMVIYKPTPEVLQKFKDGTYTGFSIEGKRINIEEVE